MTIVDAMFDRSVLKSLCQKAISVGQKERTSRNNNTVEVIICVGGVEFQLVCQFLFPSLFRNFK